jgi:hypothetical protein
MTKPLDEMTLEQRVHRALDNSVENGYEAEILNNSLQETAVDLADCDAGLEGVDIHDLEPCIASWLVKRGFLS